MTDRTNAFPATEMTWLGAQVEAGDALARERARHHVMSVYLQPLIIYIKGSSYRSLADPEDLVGGFFSDRLQRDDYLHKWLGSGLPLRVWLIRGLKYYCMERIRVAGRDAAERMPDDARDEATSGPRSDFRRQVARNMVREAMQLTGAELERDGLGEHWHVFRMHHIEGASYSRIAGAKGVSEDRAAVMSRTAARRLRARLRELCAWPGATNEQIDGEILSLFD